MQASQVNPIPNLQPALSGRAGHVFAILTDHMVGKARNAPRGWASRSENMQGLTQIPIHDVGPEFPLATLEREPARAEALIEGATRGVPRAALKALDAVSRRWLAKQDSVHLDEIDAIAKRLGRPG